MTLRDTNMHDRNRSHFRRVLMGVPSYQLTSNFSANCQLTTDFS